MQEKNATGESHSECIEDASKDAAAGQGPIGSIQLIDELGEIKLVPVPSRDPNDPLRLPEWRKWMCLVTVCLYAGIGLSAIQAIAGILPTMATYYMGLDNLSHAGAIGARAEPGGSMPSVPGAPSYTTISQLGTLPSLFVGVGGILSVLLAQWIGTRSVMILDSALLVATLVASALSHGEARGLYSHIATRCVMGLAVGSVESLVPLILRDLHYVHERNSRIAAMWASGGIFGAGIGIASTYIVSALSWRWFYWILAIAAGVTFLMVLAFVPETTWLRTEEDHRGASVIGEDGFSTPVQASNKPYSFWHSIRLVSGHGSLRAVLGAAIDLARCACLPNVIWVICLNAVFIGISISAGIEFGIVLVVPPWNWKESNVGLIGVPLAISGFLSVLISGWGADRIVRLMARRNYGVHEPEHQLVNMILPVITGFIGALLFGIACGNPSKYHWAVAMVAFGLQQFGFVSANVIATTYTIECFPGFGSALVILVGALRNIVGFGISYGVVSFVDRNGFLGCFGTYSGLLAGIALLGIPFYVYGKRLRGSMQRWKVGDVSL